MHSEEITLRGFRQADLPAVQALILETIDISYTNVYPPSAMEHFREHHTFEEILADATAGYTVVLILDGRIVGTGTLVGGKVTRVYVAPTHQRRGLGKKIMADLERQARTSGHGRVRLYSSIPARPFYDSLGYRLEAEKAAEMADGEHLE